MKTVIRAALYARYSDEKQRATSIVDQFRNCRARAQAEGWEVVREFADEAITGSTSARPQYQAILAAADREEFDVLLLDDLSRLTRDSVEQEQTMRRLEFQGIRIVSISDGYDSEHKGKKVHRGMKGLMNEMFLDDLRDRVHRGLAGQAERGYWCGGRPYGFDLKPILDPNKLDPYGQPARVATVLVINEDQANIVREIFTRYADGASCKTIADELNARGIPSPGSTWKRKTRRCSKWVASGVRVIVHNPLYTGRVVWNKSQFVRNPDTGRYKRRKRPEADWKEFQDDSLQIVTPELFERAQRRTRDRSNPDKRLKSGYKPKYLLSGLLKCDCCNSHFVMADNRSYACSTFIGGGKSACVNHIRVRRDALEKAILTPVMDQLLCPQRVERMAREIQRLYEARVNDEVDRLEKFPQEVRKLEERIGRLRERLRQGDPDMEPDELHAAIERAEAKRRELLTPRLATKESAKLMTLLPRAAELYRQQIEEGLTGFATATQKARLVLRELLGEIRLHPGPDKSLWALFQMSPALLIKSAGTGGRGDRI